MKIEKERVGGRGKKLPYKTQIKRLPTPIIPDVERIEEDYIRTILGKQKEREILILDVDQLKRKIRRIIKNKNNAIISYKKLLIELFGEEVDLNL